MLRLTTTTRALEIVLAGAVTTNQLSFLASWSDSSTAGYLGGATPGLTNSGTAVTMVAAPAAGAVRDVDCVDVVNLDTAAATVTIRYNDNGTLYSLFKATLAVGDQLTYTHGQGWKVLDTSGSIKAGSGGTGDMILAAEQTVTGAKTFNATKLLLRNVADTFSGLFTNTITAARTWTLPDYDATLATLAGTETLSNKTLTAPSSTGTLTHTGDVLLSGSGKRITGDFSNATVVNRMMFQTSTADGNTSVAAIPNGTATTATLSAYNNSDPTNASRIDLTALSTELRLASTYAGTGTYLPLNTYVGGFKNTEQPIAGGLRVTAAAGLGYGTGAGGTVTQATSKSTAVTLNKPCGQITTNNAALAAGATVSFSFNNSLIAESDALSLSLYGGTGTGGNKYRLNHDVSVGSAVIYITNTTAGSLSEPLYIWFNLHKGVTA